MRFHQAPRPLLQLVTAILLAPSPTLAFPNGISLNELFGRGDCTPCGYYNQLCCSAGSACYTDSNQIASCTANGNGGGQATAASGGYWEYYTTTYVETDLQTITSTMSSYLPGAAATAAATGSSCNWALNEQPCGSVCCKSGQYCFNAEQNQCTAAAGGGSSGFYSSGAAATGGAGATAGAPVRPTSSGQVVVTKTVSPTTTIPFATPVATGANITLTGEESHSSSGLSGGAIAGIVIGVIAGVLLLALLCFYCCVRGLLDGLLACFGLGGRRRRREVEVEEYERRSHHAHGGGGGRTWYGAAKPARRVERERRETHTGRNLLGIGAGLAALWAILGLKRRREDRRDKEEVSEYSYASDYYTSASSASSDDRRTRTYRSQSRR